MSKIMKRTFALALVFCMLLSVIPAANAVTVETDPVKKITYNFAGDDTPIKDITEEAVNAGTYNTDFYYLFDADWFGWTSSITKAEASGVSRSNISHAGKGYALAIKVAEGGTYDISLPYLAYTGATMKFAIVELTASVKNGLLNGYNYGTNKTSWSCLSSYLSATEAVWSGEVRICDAAGINSDGMAILATAEFKDNTEYAVICVATAAKQTRLSKLILTEAGTGAALNEAYENYASVTLHSDYVCPNAEIVGSGTHSLNLNGYKLEVASITDAAIIDTSAEATGSVVCAGRVSFRNGNGGYNGVPSAAASNKSEIIKQIGVYNATLGAYKLYSNPKFATTSTNPEKTNPLYNAEDNTVQFAVKFVVDQGVLDAVKAGGSGFQMQLRWQVDDNPEKISVLKDVDAASWAENNGAQALQITLKGLDKAEAGTVIKCTPYVYVNGNYVIGAAMTFEVPAA